MADPSTTPRTHGSNEQLTGQELLPCPWCGEAAVFKPSSDPDEFAEWIGCMSDACQVMPYGTFNTAHQAIAAWNTRAKCEHEQLAEDYYDAYLDVRKGKDRDERDSLRADNARLREALEKYECLVVEFADKLCEMPGRTCHDRGGHLFCGPCRAQAALTKAGG